MGLKFILTFLIVIIVLVSLLVELSNTKGQGKIFTKYLEFTNTTFIEVSTERMQGWTYATLGLRDKGILTLENVVFHSNNIESLLANKGKIIKNVIFLEGDVMMQDKDGYTYKTQNANYHKKTEIFKITSAFIARRNEDVIQGQTLCYDMLKKEVFASYIDAVLYTIKK